MAEERIESYPFDSNPPTEFDDYGRPIYDRAVGAHMLRYTYKQFFSDGVFGTPGNALQIGKGDGLSVTIQPGMWIIEGAIGAVGFDTGEAKVVKLADSAPQGKVAYGIFLRFDDNDGRRSMYLVVRAGEAGGTVPSVETAPEVSELRLGYVTVPSGATNLTKATITMEKGTAACPYAAPFAEIDVDATTSQYNASAQAALNELVAYFEKYRDMVDAAVDETLAGQLQEQINQIESQLGNFDLSNSVDGVTIAYSQGLGEEKESLKVIALPDGMIVDSAGSSASASDGKVASPSCVDAKILSDHGVRDGHSVAVKYVGGVYVPASSFVNFADKKYFDVKGFNAQSDGVVPSVDIMAMMFITTKSDKAGIYIYAGGEEIVYDTISSSVYRIYFIQLSAGDKLAVKVESTVTIDELAIQGM